MSAAKNTGFPGDEGYVEPDTLTEDDYEFSDALYEDDGYKMSLSEGDEFIGTYRGAKEVITNEGELVTLFLFKDKDGKNCIQWSNFVLAKALLEAPGGPVAVGDVLKIVHDGMVELKNGNRMNRISVYKGRAKSK